MSLIRLDKFLADMQAGTRSEVKKMIRKGQVLVNGEIVKKPEFKVEADTDYVICEGKEISYVQQEYYMLNKPQGVVSATVDTKYQTVVDLITEKSRKDLFPVGRLDRDTEGLLLITNDGALCHDLLAPGKHVDKCYLTIVDGILTVQDEKAFLSPMNIGTEEQEEWVKPAKLQVLYRGNRAQLTEHEQTIVGDGLEVTKVMLTIQEGKYHQVKRMFETLGKPVIYLKRLSMGTLILDESLQLGQYRKLSEAEIALLQKK